jgi:protein kinase N
VKQGAENMIQSLTSSHSRDKKLLQEAQQMLADSRVKIEFLKLRILKIKQNKQLRQQQGTGAGDTPSNGDTHQVKGERTGRVVVHRLITYVVA